MKQPMKTFRSVTVQNYRGLSDLSIGELGQVNVLVGRNGVGKTSLLEALALACLGRQPEENIRGALARAGIINQRTLEAVYGDKESPARITLEANGSRYGVTLQPPGEARPIIRPTEHGPVAAPGARP